MQISIIVATYNRATTIARCLSSIRQQSYKNIQIVVIDGNSSDQTLPIVKPFIGKNDVLICEDDEGIYDAINKGIAQASGQIIAFLHSDDMYADNEVIEKIMQKFNENKDIDIVYGDVEHFLPKSPSKIVRRYKSSQLSLRNLSWGKMPAHPAIFIHKSVYDEIGLFKIEYKIAADYEFLCRLVKKEKYKSIYWAKTLVLMQIGGASTSGFLASLKLNVEVLKALKQNNIYSNPFMVLSKYPSKILEFFRK